MTSTVCRVLVTAVVLVHAGTAFAGEPEPDSEAAQKPSGFDLRLERAGVSVELHGYYRARGALIHNLAAERVQPDDPGGRPPWYYFDEQTRKSIEQPYKDLVWTSFLTQRVRLEPIIRFRKWVKLQLTLDALDNVVWGDNDAVATTPLFAVEPSLSGVRGDQVPAVALKRAWIDLDVKVGTLRVGRMPSHWGMGLLTHGGGTFGGPEGYMPRDFGDYNQGSTYDRILFATKPITLVKKLLGRDDTDSHLILAYAYDKLVEDPWQIELGRAYARPPGESGWLSSDADDVAEHVIALLYNNTELDWLASTDQLALGVYFVLRTQKRSFREPIKDAQGNVTGQQFTGDGSVIPIIDFWAKLRLGPIDFETEMLAIFGSTDGGVPIGGSDLRKKDARIFAGAARLGYLGRRLDGVFEVGFSSGDTDLADEVFSQRASHPDYNVGLLLYEEILRERTARTLGRTLSRGLQSNGGVFNSTYLFPRLRWRPTRWLEGIAGVLFAWRNKPTAQALLFDAKRGGYLGTEIDLALRARWAKEHLFAALEGAVLFFGDSLKDLYSRENSWGSFTLQSRLYFLF